MTPTEKMQATLSKDWFFNTQYNKNYIVKPKYLGPASSILVKCKKLLTLMQDKEARNTLYALIVQTEAVLRKATNMGNSRDETSLNLLLKRCQELQLEALKLPSNLPNEKNQALINYKIAMVCFYLLAISVCFAIGAAFGACYFGYFTGMYFADHLVVGLSAFGIPAACLGLLSYGLYRAQDTSQEDCSTLADDVGQFCDAIVTGYHLDSSNDTTEVEFSM